MPMLAVHLSIAQEVVDRLAVAEISECLGAVLLGSTSPDRRVMTREPRENTHYFQLTESGMGDGFRGLKAALPELAERAPESDWMLTAFLVGYASHLAADEAWIVNVYRPYFEDEAYLGGEPARNILDRAMQYELERGVRRGSSQLRKWQGQIASIEGALNSVPDHFIPEDVLREWNEFVVGRVMNLTGGWEEFPRFIVRFLDDPGLDEAVAASLIQDPDAMLSRVYDKIPREIVQHHRAIAVEESMRHAREILA